MCRKVRRARGTSAAKAVSHSSPKCRVSFSRFGAVRWLLGLAFGLAAAFGLGSVSPQSVTRLYFGVYVLLRVAEWSIMVTLFALGEPAPCTLTRRSKTWLWVLGGIAVSFASDLASPEGMAGRFCVGRCLC